MGCSLYLAAFSSRYLALASSIDLALSVLSSIGSALPQQTKRATFFFDSSFWNFFRNFSGSPVHLCIWMPLPTMTSSYSVMSLTLSCLRLTTLTSNPSLLSVSAISSEVLAVAPYRVP
jgi:hypothetical protein